MNETQVMDGAAEPVLKRAQGRRRVAGTERGVFWGQEPQSSIKEETILLTVLCFVSAAAIAANVLYLFPNVTVNRKG